MKHYFSLKSMVERLFSHESKERKGLLSILIKYTKLHKRILLTYAGIVRNKLETFFKKNFEHCQKNPIFRNIPPLQPVVSHTPNSRHQIDLVCFDKGPHVVKDGKVYMYVISVLDVFSRYVFLRPTTSKEPKEIKEILADIYR